MKPRDSWCHLGCGNPSIKRGGSENAKPYGYTEQLERNVSKAHYARSKFAAKYDPIESEKVHSSLHATCLWKRAVTNLADQQPPLWANVENHLLVPPLWAPLPVAPLCFQTIFFLVKVRLSKLSNTRNLLRSLPTPGGPSMRISASCAVRQRNVILLAVCTRISLRKGVVFTLKNTLMRAGRGEASPGGARVWAECFWDKGSNWAGTSQQRERRDREGCSQWEGRKRLPSVLTLPLLPPTQILAESKELVSYLVEVCVFFFFFLNLRQGWACVQINGVGQSYLVWTHAEKNLWE